MVVEGMERCYVYIDKLLFCPTNVNRWIFLVLEETKFKTNTESTEDSKGHGEKSFLGGDGKARS